MYRRTAVIAVYGIVIFLLGAIYGILAGSRHWFPYSHYAYVRQSIGKVSAELSTPWYLDLPGGGVEIENPDPGLLQPGLVMITGVSRDRRTFVKVIDRSGALVHQWQPDWFEIWGDRGNFPPARQPKRQPGALLHGTLLLDNGDLVVNFEHLSTMRLTACGKVVWKLPNLGHHSVSLDSDNNLWVSAEELIRSGDTGQPNHKAPFHNWLIQKISLDGKVLRTISVLDVLQKNDLVGLLHMSSTNNWTTVVTGDTLHLNDVEVYPADFTSTIFSKGDIMVSLRNISTVLVFDPETLKIKYRSTGQALRQHDPDFIGGDEILVLDNHNLAPEPKLFSRLLVLDAATQTATPVFTGKDRTRFFSSILGKQQLLENGNLMVTASMQGRAFETNRAGDLLWQFENKSTGEKNGIVSDATVLPQRMDKAFFQGISSNCN